MDKVYNHKDVEDRIYKNWEENGYFKPEVNPKGKSYCIILPPPNANGALHFGHAMFVVEDILIRYHRMKGFSALWLPGTDHAGIETQFVFEKKLKLEGKSRLDFNQETLYQMIHKYVEEHRGGIQQQLRKLGFSLDWSREKYTLDPDVIKIVKQTFKKMYDEGLVYRDYRLVNYCTFDGTSFSDLEVVYEERQNPLYYIKYGPLVLATTRPETKFGDTAVAVHPTDARYKKYIGQEIEIETVLGRAKIKVIADESVDPEFGTGVVKITPAHDFNDFETGKRHHLPLKQVIGFDGKMNDHAGKFAGMYIKQARLAIVEEMQQKGLIEKIDTNYVHRIGLCYKCKNVLEPLPLEQWFIKVKSLAQKAIEVVKKREVMIVPKSFESQYFFWLENLRDWNISRQIVWGIRIPAWKCLHCHPVILGSGATPGSETDSGQARLAGALAKRARMTKESLWIVTDGEKPEKCPNCDSKDLVQDTDTFDTWFSSAQWPFVTLMSNSNSKFKIQNSKLRNENISDYERFYPTSVMETGYDLLRAWVSRMVMMGVYITGKVPFQDVLFHGLVNDPYGKKMSKSKGNVVNVMDLIEQYGADSVRFALVYGNATGNDQSLSYPKLDAARKFTNKLWNIARFITLCHPKLVSGSDSGQARMTDEMPKQVRHDTRELLELAKNENDREMIEKTQNVINGVSIDLDSYHFNFAAEKLYNFTWHEFADKYIKQFKIQNSKVKSSEQSSFMILNSLFIILLKLLHPFMPFVTEEIYGRLAAFGEPKRGEDSIMISKWPMLTL